MSRVVALVAARDEADRVGDTAIALRRIDAVDEVVVVDDGSRDDTASRALAAGATVLRLDRSRGKGGALEGALGRLPPADAWLLADADLGSSASGLAAVLRPVLGGEVDLAVAVLPAAQGGGFGLVKRSSRRVIRRLTGLELAEPLSGQRALSSSALAAVRPFASGFGIEAAMSIDAARAGLRMREVRTDLAHRPTMRDLRGFAHRGRQGWDILRALAPRALGIR